MELFYYNHNKQFRTEKLRQVKTTFIEITFVLSGTMEYVINKNPIILQSGDVFCLPAHSLRMRKAVEHSDYISFNFFPENGDEPIPLPLRIENGLTNDIKLLLSASDEIYAQTGEANEQLTLLIKCIIKQLIAHQNTRNSSSLTLKIKKYVAEHLTERITLEDIGNMTFFSPSHCSAVFRKEMGMSIGDYILDEKIKKIKTLIFEGVPLSTVAEKMGFMDYNYFSRIFKKRVGYTPTQYKNLTFIKL